MFQALDNISNSLNPADSTSAKQPSILSYANVLAKIPGTTLQADESGPSTRAPVTRKATPKKVPTWVEP